MHGAAGLLLNQLGNAEGAVNEWELACKHYKQAADSAPEIESLALANLALANCELRVGASLNVLVLVQLFSCDDVQTRHPWVTPHPVAAHLLFEDASKPVYCPLSH